MGDSMSKRLKLVTGSESEERSFLNPFPDWDQGAFSPSPSGAHDTTADLFDANGKITEAFQKKVQNKIKDLLQQMEEGLKTADPHDFSTYTGWTGIALLYLQLHRVTDDVSHLHRSLDYVKRTLRNLNGRKVTFLCGDAGPLAVGAVVHHRLKNQADSKECLTKLLQLQRSVISPDLEIPDELLYGRAGYLYALLFVNKEIGPDTVDESTIAKVVTTILESGKNLSKEEKKTERCPLLYEWHKKQYVGAAHGLGGIYYMLMQPTAKVNPDVLTELVRPSVDYVRHKKFRSGNYPSSLSNETDRLVHWCHGAPGVVHMLIMAHKVFKDDKYLKDAVECGEVIWQRGLLRKGYGICHGAAGNGYAFLSLYKLTQEQKYLYRACKFAEWCLDYGKHGCRIPDRPYSLFEVHTKLSSVMKALRV
ncbi:lanC-like protein 2 isoform X2 [Trichomycterus rosablanca]|uniref:lanC-like protein 2 isoform X2 n=1 Tax=Trichomycterus rosablanca TaxID=2290929 RepID=UPI002F35743A